MRKLMFIVLIISMITMSGCRTDLQSNSSFEAIAIDYSNNIDTDESVNMESAAENQSFSFSVQMNVSEISETGSSDLSVGYKMNIIETKKVDLVLSTMVIPDRSIIRDEIPVKCFIVADGELVSFSVDGGSFSIQNTFAVKPETLSKVIVSFIGNPDMRYISVVVCAFPDDIPALGIGLYSGVCTYSIVNISNKNKEVDFVKNSDNYLSIKMNDDLFGIGIDTLSFQDNNKANSTQNLDDIIVHKGKDDLWIKFKEDASVNGIDYLGGYYSLFVLCNGDVLPVFSGEYTRTLFTPVIHEENSNTDVFQFPIPEEYLPDDGLNTFQAIAGPYYIPEAEKQIDECGSIALKGFSTPKTRVVIQ